MDERALAKAVDGLEMERTYETVLMGAGEQIAPITGFAYGVLVPGMAAEVMTDIIANMGR